MEMKNNNHTYLIRVGLLIFFLNLIFQYSLLSQVNNWVGGTGNWNNPSNWSQGSVPGTNDEIVIGSSGVVTINGGTNAYGIDLYNTGKIIISSNATLTLDGASNNGLHSEGILINNGSIYVYNAAGYGALIDSLENSGLIDIANSGDDGLVYSGSSLFVNESGGQINILNSEVGLNIQNGPYLFNKPNAQININHTRSYGVLSFQPIYNYGTVNVQNSGLTGLKSYDIIYNGINANISIKNTVENGLELEDELNNHGTISCDAGISKFGILMIDTLNNHLGGDIILNDIGIQGIKMSNSFGYLENSGEIEVGPTVWAHALNVFAGKAVNKPSGEIRISGSDSYYITNDGDILNQGLIVLSGNGGGVGDRGILNTENFTNDFCGVIISNRVISNSDKFDNYGFIHSSNTIYFGSHFNNFGAIDQENSYFNSGSFASNNGMFIEDLTGPFYEWQSIPNIIKGTGTGLEIFNNTVYCDENLTLNAGQYNVQTNEWVPNAKAVGKDTFYLGINYISTYNCLEVHKLVLSDTIQMSCGDITFTGTNSSSWNDISNWDRMRLPMPCDTVVIPFGKNSSIGVSDSFSISRIVNNGMTSILSGGKLNSGTGSKYGLENAGTFNVLGTLYASNSTDRGISNTGTFEINDGRTIVANTKNGIYNSGIGTVFRNNGILDIDNTSDYDIDNNSLAEFENKVCGELYLNGKIYCSSIFNNNGKILQSSAASHSIFQNVFVNNGLIETSDGSWSSVSITNNGYLTKYINGNHFEGVEIQGALLGNGTGLSILNNSWYETNNFQNVMGSFNPSNKSFTPTGAAIGKDFFVFQVDNGNSCPTTGAVFFENPVQIKCGDIIFTGGNGNWEDPSNWDKNRLPTDCDIVFINSGSTVTIAAGVTAEAKRIINSGVLNINQNSILNVTNSSSSGIFCDSQINNSGTINVSNASSSSIFMTNGGKLNNQQTGVVKIDSSGSDGIYLTNPTTELNNLGSIVFEGQLAGSAIVVWDTSKVVSSGSISIPGKTLNSAIRVSFGSEFDNQSGAIISCQESDDLIFVNGTGSSFSNSGKIIGVNTNHGFGLIITTGSFMNTASGEIRLNNSINSRIFVSNTGQLINNGKIDLGSIHNAPEIRLESNASFSNGLCGKLFSTGRWNFSQGTTLLNLGFISHNYAGTEGIDMNTISNSGVIEDVQGNISSGFQSNAGYHVKPVGTQTTEGVPVLSVLSGSGTGINITSTFFITELATVSAGNYISSNNSWIPNNLAVGQSKFYFIADNGNSCPDTVEINFTFPVLPACVGGPINWIGGPAGNWHVGSNWDLGHAPKTCEDVFIPAGVITTINAGSFAEARSIHLNGSLVNNGQMIVAGAADKPGIHNFGGSVENNGTLFIGQVTGANGNNHGIKNEGVGSTFSNHGSLTIDGVDDYGILNEVGATLMLNGVSMISNYGIDAIKNDLGASIGGSGDVDLGGGFWDNNGSLTPGSSIGGVSVIGNYISTISANIELEIDGNAGAGITGGHDVIEVSGDITLRGTLNVYLGGGFIPQESDVYTIFSYTGSITGSFGVVNFPNEMSGWQVDYGVLLPGKVTLYQSPVNDLCNNSIPISLTSIGSVIKSGHTFAAQSTGHPGTCDTDLSTAPGIWYELTVSNFLDYSITLCNSDFDTKIGLFSGACNNISCIKGNDDDNALNGLNVCNESIHSSIGLSSDEIENQYPGQVTSKIWIYISGYSSSRGVFEMEITSTKPSCTPNINIWFGGGSNAWNDASQWGLNHIPKYCERIDIQSGLVVIPNGYPAMAQSIYLGGQLINNGGSLVIEGADNQPGMDVVGGMLDNKGLLYFKNITGFMGVGLDAGSTATIVNDGTIQTSSISGVDMIIRSGCVYTNRGVINLQN